VIRRYKTPYQKRKYARKRRLALAGKSLCINNGSHGRATHGVLCDACRLVHRESA
jgi:hypothetical protein